MENDNLFNFDDDRNEAQIVMTDLFVILFLVALFLMGEDLITLATPEAAAPSHQQTTEESIRIFLHGEDHMTLDRPDGPRVDLEQLTKALDGRDGDIVLFFSYDVPGGKLHGFQAELYSKGHVVRRQAVFSGN